MKKTLLFVITKPSWGGAGRYVFDLAKELKERYEVVVLLGGGEGPLGEKLRAEGIRNISAPSLARDIRTHKDIAAFFELLAILKKEKPDIVHVNSSKAGGLGALAARIARIRMVVYTVHGWAFNEPVSSRAKFFRFMASLATMIFARRVITVSEFDEMHSPLGLHTQTVHNGLALPAFFSREEAKQVIGPATENDLGLLIGTIAELHRNKGIDTLLHAFAGTKEGGLVIIGAGEERGRLEALARELAIESRVRFLGFVDNAASLLKAFDIFVLSSRKEGLPYVLLEAGYAERPVIASIVGGIPEIIEDQLSGLLVPANDVSALKNALEELIENPVTRARYGNNLKEKVEKSFSLPEMVRKTIEIYES